MAAPGLLLSADDGQIRRGGVSGWYVDDVRLLDRVEVSLVGSDLELVRSSTTGAGSQQFGYVARRLGDAIGDPTVLVDRVRTLEPKRLIERFAVSSSAQEAVDIVLHLDLGGDLAPMAQVRRGVTGDQVPPTTSGTSLSWSNGSRSFEASFAPAPDTVDDACGRVTWTAALSRGERLEVTCTASTGDASQFEPGGAVPWDEQVAVVSPDVRLGRVVEQSLADLAGLLLRDGDDQFLAAGSPWFLTLFGRDSLWAARMLAPFSSDLVLSTLRTLARRQGTKDDLETEEQPGKILHEIRNAELDLGDLSLPPLYYGSIDATPLFVCALADAHRWGADPRQVAGLLPAARRCLGLVLAQSQESGWLRYVDHTGHGLANQGWKDSHDSVQFADGQLAEAPIALSEVQAYAYEAAVRGAALLEAFGEPEVEGLAAWARSLRKRFAEEFWVDTERGGHVAIALDGHGARVDSITSNMGHLLGTGILDASRVTQVVSILNAPDMDSGFGFRTLSSRSPRFSRLSYHGGVVWPHDTAIAVRGLAAEGFLEEAARATRQLVHAAEGFDYRLPELYGGDASADVPFPTAYPAACRPQAWAAAAPLAALVAATGIEVDAPNGKVSHPERVSTTLGPFTLRGLRVGSTSMGVHVDAEGAVRIDLAEGSGLTVTVRTVG